MCHICGDPNHLYYHTGKNLWHCWKCGTGGRGKPPNYRTRLMPKKEEKALVGEDAGNLPDGFRLIDPTYRTSIIARRCLAYLFMRGLTLKEIIKYEVGFVYSEVIFPIFDNESVLKYWVARNLTKQPFLKYRNAPWPRSGTFFRSLSARKPRHPVLALVEGVFDAIMLGRILPTYAMLGKQITDEGIRVLQGVTTQLVIVLDPDAKGDAMELQHKLRGYFDRVSILPMWGKKDPAEDWEGIGKQLKER